MLDIQEGGTATDRDGYSTVLKHKRENTSSVEGRFSCVSAMTVTIRRMQMLADWVRLVIPLVKSPVSCFVLENVLGSEALKSTSPSAIL